MKTLSSILLLCCLLAACSRGPEPISYGKESCAHCKMTIMDKRFAAEVVTARGKIYKFDAAECMAGFLKENPAITADPNSTFLVNDFSSPEQFRDARKAWFLRDSSFNSPMGGNLAAFQSRRDAVAQEKDQHAEVMDWTALLKQGK